MKQTDLYLDVEWFHNQQLFLIGYGYSLTRAGQLYEDTLTREHFLEILAPVDGHIFFYGPDIGMLEKSFGMDIRNTYRCVNLLYLFRQIMPGMESYRLAYFEELFGIARSTKQYKTNIFKLFDDWYKPWKRRQVLKYNREDVLNLIRLNKQVCAIYGITPEVLDGFLMG